MESNAHASIPIVAQLDVILDHRIREKAERLARRLLANEPALNNTAVFGPNVSSGLSGAPAIFFEDHSEISLFDVREDSPLEYRSLLLAGDEDIVLIGGRRHRPFEIYCRDKLGIGRPAVLSPAAPTDSRFVPLSERCIADAALMDRICSYAARHSELNIVPYIGTGNAWRLAQAISLRCAMEVLVAAAPPRLTRRVNDKLWFAEQVQTLLDRRALPESYSVFGPAALAARVAALGARFGRVVVKVPDSSGSLGNVALSSDDISRWSLADLRKRILDILEERGWRGTYPLLVGVWEQPVIASPSVNVWIPDPSDGTPIVEGVFAQVLSGPEGAFIGAMRSDLPAIWQQRLADEAMAIAYLFQRIGYFGRCGFDAILIGRSCDDAELHWIECNGRWGGVSSPVTLANRLIGDWQEKAILIVQRTQLTMPPRGFDQILTLLDGHLFDSRASCDGVVLLVPGRMVDGSGLNLMIVADTPAAAQDKALLVTALLASHT